MNHKMRFAWLFVSLTVALVLIGLGVIMLQAESPAVAQSNTALRESLQGRRFAAPASIFVAVGLVTYGPELNDGGFDELSYAGVLRAASESGITYQVYTSTAEADYIPNLQRCALDGNALCIGVSFFMADAISQTAALHPGTLFALVDNQWDNTPPNLRGMTFAEDQVGYLAGTLAALMSDSRVIGAVGGWEIPPVRRFIDGYRNGARCAAPATTVLITYTWTFVDPEIGAQAAQEMLGQGADVIFGVAGATGNGAILTATQSGAWAIGVDTDQYLTVFDNGGVAGSERLLSSAMKRLDNAVFDTIGDVISGTFTSGTVLYSLAEDGVGLAPFHETEPLIPVSVRSRLSGVEQGLREGWLTVDGPCVATIGVAADLSGPAADLGWQQVNAVQLAISQTNAEGGLNLGGMQYMLHLAVADDGCDGAQAAPAAQSLLDAGALAVVGHTCSVASIPAQAVYAAADIPMISPSSTNPNLTRQGYTTTFRVISHDGSPPAQLATYLRQWGGYSRSAVVSAEGYYQWAIDFYSSTFTTLGGTITGYHIVTDTGDFAALAATIKHTEQPDVIFYADSDANRAGMFSRAMHEVGMNDVPIAWSSWDNAPWLLDAYAAAAGPSVEDDFVMMQHRPFWAMPGWETFRAEYQAAGFPNTPDDPGIVGVFAYDAARIALDALDQAQDPAPGGVRHAVAATGYYDGVIGLYQGFDGYGDVIPQWCWIERYRAGQWTPVFAIPEFGAELHVCAGHCDFDSIQAAVDAANDGDIVKVAGGTYSDLHDRAAPPGYYGPSVITQVVYIDKNITLRGGYSILDWDMPAPLVNVTTIDAQGGGRALVIVGNGIRPVVEGFRITGGDAAGLGGVDFFPGGSPAGGGIYVSGAAPRLSRNWIYGNRADFGGGVYLDFSPDGATLSDNEITGNTASWGGGLSVLRYHPATIVNNLFADNHAMGWPPERGGAVDIRQEKEPYAITFSGNTVISNTAGDYAGGIAVFRGQHVFTQNEIRSNSAITGGGLYLDESEAQIIDNVIAHNTATQDGGGMALRDSKAWIQWNDIFSNTAQGNGGGVHSYSTHFGFEEYGGSALYGNHIHGNTARGGGGVFLDFSWANLANNTFEDNEATGTGSGVGGGGLYLLLSDAIVDRNTFKANSAGQGGALGFQGGNAKVYNNFIFENQATERGSAIYTFGASPYVAHNTIARNTGGDGSAIYSTYWEPFDQTWDLVNTIIYDQSIGIKASGAITINLDHVLWHNTPVTVTKDATATILAQAQLTGDPLFVNPGAGDYHITAPSPARDAGMEMVDVTQDIDGQVRPMGMGYDIGADEYPGSHLVLSAGTPATLLLPGQTFTYNVALANDGALTATGTTLTFALDPRQRAVAVTPGGMCTFDGAWGGTVVCPLGAMPPGAETPFVVTAQVAASAPPWHVMWSTAEATSNETPASSASVKTVSRAGAVSPPSTVIALGQEPDTLYVYADESSAAVTVRNALMDGPFTNLDYAYQTTILTEVPELQDGGMAFRSTTVMSGSQVVDDGGDVVTLAPGIRIRPSGCRSSACAITFAGASVTMEQIIVTFTLRSGIRWSDGVTLTTQDAIFGQQIACDPGTPQSKMTCERTASYTAVDAFTTVWTSLPGYWSQTANLNFWTPLPYHALGGQTAAEIHDGEYGRAPLGWGPYRVLKWEPGAFIILERNPYYWRAGYPKLDRVTFVFMQDAAEIYAAMERGEIHLASQTTSVANDYANILLDPDRTAPVQLLWTTGTAWEHTDFGILPADTRYAFFADPQVRRAVAYAIDRQRIIDEAWYGLDSVPNAYVPEAHPLYTSTLVTYPYSPTLAAALLTAAGWVDTNSNGIRNKDGREFIITYAATDAAKRIQAGGIVQENLAAVGIQVNLDFQPFGELYADGPDGPVFGRKFDLASFAWIGGVEPPCELYLSSQIPMEATGWAGQNNPGYSNLAYDAACEQALASWPGTPAYIVGHQTAMRILSEDVPILPTFRRLKLAAVSTAFMVGPDLDSTESAETWNIWEWDFQPVEPCYVRVSSVPSFTYNDLQAAVDAAQPGDSLKVAGTCTTVHSRPRRDLTTTGVVTQVAYIAKSLTLQGGYTTTNWLHPNPAANPTTLNAQGQGRVLYVTGAVNVTLDGFRITGGDAARQGGSPFAVADAGGGVYVITATVAFRNNRVFDNVANGSGGGVYLHHSPSTLEFNTFSLNRSGLGGGVSLYISPATLRKNIVTGNNVTDSGGGLYLHYSYATVEGNRVFTNTAANYGGGVSILENNPLVNGNLVRFNSATYGGGFDLNRVGGRYANNVIADNQASVEGSGIYARGATARLLHTTLARNGGGSGIFITAAPGSIYSALVMTNTIMAGHGVGINITGGNALTANTLLWHNTPVTVTQSPTATVTVLNDWIADPLFDADGYHLRIGSPAIDVGVPAALTRDVDGDPRPYGSGFDLGADEVPTVLVEPVTGGTLVYTNTEGSATTLVVPPNAVTQTVTIVLTQLDPATTPTSPTLAAGGIALQLDAYRGDTHLPGFTFDAPVTLTLAYTDADVAGMDESTLQLYRHVCANPGSCVWEIIRTRAGEGQTPDTGNNVLTAWLVGFSKFRTLGAVLQPVFEVSKMCTSSGVAGTTATYTLTVNNTGTGDATAVILEDVVPEHLIWMSGGTFALDRVRWTFETITAMGGTGVGQFSAVLPCTTSLAIVNNDYRVVSSAQGVTSTVGLPVSFDVIAPTLTAGITYTPAAPVPGDTVYFTATATTNGTALSYQWSVGGTGLHAAHKYSEAGSYTVAFTATDTCGYVRAATAPFTVKPAGYTVYLPLVMRK